MAGSDALWSELGLAARSRLRALAAGTRPLALEIGFGHGRFLVALAAAHPELDVVGIEVHQRWVRKAEERAARAGVGNVLALKGDARVVLTLDLLPARLDHVYVLFPDPWWKPKHSRRRRMMTPELLDVLARGLRPCGTLLLRTDVLPYLESTRAFVAAHPAFAEGDPAALPACDAATHREERCALARIPTYEALWQRRSTSVDQTSSMRLRTTSQPHRS